MLMFVFVCRSSVIGTLEVLYVQYVTGFILLTKHFPEKQPADDDVHVDLESFNTHKLPFISA